MIEKLQTVIRFVYDNSGGGDTPFNPGGGYPIAPTYDATALIFALIALVGFAAGIFIFVKNFMPAVSLKNATHSACRVESEPKFNVALVICLSIFAVFFSILITKIANAQEQQNSINISPEIYAYVNDNGDIRFDEAKLNYEGSGKLLLKTLDLEYAEGITGLESCIWNIAINGNLVFSGTIPGQLGIDFDLSSENTLDFSVTGIDPQTAYSLIDRNILSINLDVEEHFDIVQIPTFASYLTYNGEEYDVSSPDYWRNFDTEKMTISGEITATDAGYYQVEFSLNPGYCWSDGTLEPAVITWTIHRANWFVIPPTGIEEEETGSPIELLDDPGFCFDWGILLYGVSEDENTMPKLFTPFIPQRTEPGIYYVWYKVDWDLNHNQFICEKPVKSEIYDDNPYAVVTVPPVGIANLVYDELRNVSHTPIAFDLVTAGKAKGGTLKYFATLNSEYTPTDADYNESIPQESNAGDYYIWYKAFHDDKHEFDSEPVCLEPVKIKQADLKLHITGNTDTKTYSNTEYTVSGYTVSAGQGEQHYYLYQEQKLSTSSPTSVTKTEVNTTQDKKWYFGMVWNSFSYDNPNINLIIEESSADGWLLIEPADRIITLDTENANLIATPNANNVGQNTIKVHAATEKFYEGEKDEISVTSDVKDFVQLAKSGNNPKDFELVITALKGASGNITIDFKNKNYVNDELTISVKVDMFTYVALATFEDIGNENEKNAAVDTYNGLNNADVAEVASSFIDDDDQTNPTKYIVVQIGNGTNPIMNNDSYAKQIKWSDKVISIADKAFLNCGVLENIVSTSKLQSIGVSAFESCSKLVQFGYVGRAITTPASLIKLSNKAFMNCNNSLLKRINLAASTQLEAIGDAAFKSCYGVEEVLIPEIGTDKKLTYIGQEAFANLISYKFSEEDNNITYDKNHTAILWAGSNIDADKKTYPEFDEERFEVPATVKLIASKAFNQRNNLKKFIVPDSVIFINDKALSNCEKLETYLDKSSQDSTIIYGGNNVLDNCFSKDRTDSKKFIVAGVKDNLPGGSIKNRANFVFNEVNALPSSFVENTYYYLNGPITNVTSQYVIDKNCIIDVNGHYIKSSTENKTRIFSVTASNFYLLDTSLTASTSPESENANEGYIQGFANDNQKNGGGIDISGATTLFIYDGCFNNCSASTSGGAISLNNASCKINMYNCYFNKCESVKSGGAIFVNACENFSIYKGEFIQCSVSDGSANGGAIASEVKLRWIEGCNFIENNCGNKGGAIYCGGDHLYDVRESIFKNNFSDKDGGAIYVNGYIESFLLDLEFISNKSLHGNGGAVYVNSCDERKRAIWDIQGCKFDSNEAHSEKDSGSGSGGALYIANGTIGFIGEHSSRESKTIFEYNSCWGSNGNGGAIYLCLNEEDDDYYTRIDNYSEFIGNHTGNGDKSTNARGGAIYNAGTAPLYIVSAELIKNYDSVLPATNNGAALYASVTGNIRIDNVEHCIGQNVVSGPAVMNIFPLECYFIKED